MKGKKKIAKDEQGVSRRDFLKWTGAVTAGVAAGGLVSGTFPDASMAQTPSGTLQVVTTVDADTFDPHAWISSDTYWIGYQIFEQLVTLDYEPMLATSWENPDKLTWIFHLKKNVEFTNGDSFDASTVKFNLERMLDPQTKSVYRGLLEPIESVESMDKNTVKVKTKTPFAVFLAVLSLTPMVSPKAVKDLGKEFSRRPIGTGPFVFKEWVPMERTVLEANMAYYGTKPKVKTVIWRPIAEASTRIVELRTGKAHLINKVPPELAGEISGEGLRVVRKRSFWRMGIKLNIAKPPFDNVKVRQAFNYAADKESLIKNILYGAGYIASDHLGPDREGYNPDLKPYRHDPSLSRKLLAEAGYPNGVDIEILTPIGRYLKDKEIVEAVSYQVKDAGFNMKVVAVEWGMFLRTYRNHNGFFMGIDNPTHRAFFNDGYSPGKAFSWMGYQNEEFNKLYEEAGATFDVQKRKAIYQKMDKIFWEEPPYLYMYYAQDIYGLSDRVKDFVPRADGYIVLHNVSLV
jgi:peptide/nickel transport system substrate-binding protein